MKDVYERARAVRLAIFDVDGVLTEGGLHYSDSGAEVKVFNVRDGHGLKMLQASGVEVAIITSRRSRALEIRARDLGIALLYQGAADKLATCRELLRRVGLEAQAASFIGDDILDLDVFEGVPEGLYRKAVFSIDGGPALVYVPSDRARGKPERDYLAAVVSAAQYHRLPNDYIKELQGWGGW